MDVGFKMARLWTAKSTKRALSFAGFVCFVPFVVQTFFIVLIDLCTLVGHLKLSASDLCFFATLEPLYSRQLAFLVRFGEDVDVLPLPRTLYALNGW